MEQCECLRTRYGSLASHFYAGIFMLLIGAVGMFLTAGRKKREEVTR